METVRSTEKIEKGVYQNGRKRTETDETEN
ncbi:hypothetical protein SDC9_200696 [bioreactor metagenome]|uniref:Uncharacterized protein n=1 Tax=bioreactor metagenome TaxID=1076179 RepID=A0A645J0R3_9ZZZZ